MVSYEAYTVIHILGIMLLLLSLGAYLILSMNKSVKGKKLAAITHGIAILIILVAGFGLLARIGYMSVNNWPLWAWLKLAIWLILALIIIPIKRMPNLIPVLWFLIPILGALAAYLAIYKIDF
ncbi:MAG: hypothetical protein L0Y68_07400 [Candidatus Dadabacteria bacterium]|nr:hypothetical protein [Candidatus Dadabacteria bacterium]